MAIETPDYEVIKTEGDFEIRKYAGYVTANVTIQADGYKQAANAGFSYLADYIFGNNHGSGKISMTAPVNTKKLGSQKIVMTAPVNTTQQGNSYLVSFTMPSQYKMDDLPTPNNTDVSLTEVEPFWSAAVTFSGYITDKKLDLYSIKLKDWATRNKLETIGQPVYSQFNPPWTPWFLRHNEIYFYIKSID